MEVVGQTLTEEKHCPKCGVTKSLDEFHRHSKHSSGYETYCKPCQNENSRKSNKTMMFVNGKHISKKHPLHKPGRYKSFGDAAFESLSNYKTAKEGQVYIMISPSYKHWVKVGMAVDAEDRLKQFQTGSPYRDYKLVYTKDVEDRREAEKVAHKICEEFCIRKGEWFMNAQFNNGYLDYFVKLIDSKLNEALDKEDNDENN